MRSGKKIQNSTEWSSSVEKKRLDKISAQKKLKKKTPYWNNIPIQAKTPTKRCIGQFSIRYRGDVTRKFSSRLNKLCKI